MSRSCNQCGGDLTPVPCPDGMPGCMVTHYACPVCDGATTVVNVPGYDATPEGCPPNLAACSFCRRWDRKLAGGNAATCCYECARMLVRVFEGMSCEASVVVSRTCERGTKGCAVHHGAA